MNKRPNPYSMPCLDASRFGGERAVCKREKGHKGQHKDGGLYWGRHEGVENEKRQTKD